MCVKLKNNSSLTIIMEEVSLDIDGTLQDVGSNDISTTKFGPGIELLMNEKNIPLSGGGNIEVGDLNALENELNDLTGTGGGSSVNLGETVNLSSFEDKPSTIKLDTEPIQLNIDEDKTDSKLGAATAETIGQNSDGFLKQATSFFNPAPPKMNEREMRRKKRLMLKKLDGWHEKGQLKGYNNLTMESPYDEIEDEYETAMEDKRTKDSIKLQGWWFMTAVNSLEYANAAFDPFGVNLDGWGEQINDDIDSYEEIFAELHDKYKGAKMAPELSLVLRLGFSAAVVSFTNKALSSSAPGFNDVIRQNPDLMKAFTDATVDTMSQKSPGFAFANEMMKEEDMRPKGGPPPAPQQTKVGRDARTSLNSRPDLRSSMNEEGVELNGFGSLNSQEKSARPEMRGPKNDDIENILAGLKTKNITINKEKEDSVVSATSLGDLSQSSGKMPKRTQKRKQKSDKNTVTLDI